MREVGVIIPTIGRANILEKSIPTYFSRYTKEIIIGVDDGPNIIEYIKVLNKLQKYLLTKE